jgi:hypothetical protein
MTVSTTSRRTPIPYPLILVSTGTDQATAGALPPGRGRGVPPFIRLHPVPANPDEDDSDEDHICRGEN